MLASRCIFIALLFALALVILASAQPEEATCSGSSNGDDKSCLDPQQGVQRNANANAGSGSSGRRTNADARVNAIFRNESPYRADIHYDDGRFGRVVGTASEKGGTVEITSFPTHKFFVTLHGVRESLVDPSTDEQYFFTIGHDNEGEMQQFVLPESAAPSTTKCKDRYPVCANEAERGECTRNPGWMIVNCCQSCDDKEGYGHLIDSEVRCTPERLNNTIPAWKEGSLDELFARWATEEEYQQYQPNVISSPNRVHGATHDGPWILTFDNFLDEYEIRQLLHGATFGEGFQRSTDQGKIISGSGEMVKVTSKTRTSTNAWCRKECEELHGVVRVSDRIEHVTGIPQNNYESFQILKYEEGQFYRTHHDSSNANKHKPTGHRILTFFLYLNDVEEGGETRFTNLDISVKPKKGRALVWPSVLNEDVYSSDQRMYHEAKEVIKGTKYAANHWIHQYDFRNANLWGCNGSFN